MSTSNGLHLSQYQYCGVLVAREDSTMHERYRHESGNMQAFRDDG